MDYVELAVSQKRPQFPVCSYAERERLRESTQQHRASLIEVERIDKAEWLWWQTTGPAIGIEALQLVNPDRLYDNWVRIAGQKVNLMAQVDQCLGEIVDVDTLSTTKGMPSI